MNHPMSDDGLERALRSLPRSGAETDFTRRLIARLPRPEARRGDLVPRLALGALALVVVVGLALQLGSRAPTAPDGRAEALRREHRELQRELESLRRAAAREPLVVYVDGSENLDVVVDLQPLVDQMRSAVRPASYDRTRPGPALGRQP